MVARTLLERQVEVEGFQMIPESQVARIKEILRAATLEKPRLDASGTREFPGEVVEVIIGSVNRLVAEDTDMLADSPRVLVHQFLGIQRPRQTGGGAEFIGIVQMLMPAASER